MSPALSKYIEQLKTNDPRWTSIDFNFDDIRYEEAKAIANTLKANNTLASIDLSGNNIGDEGAKVIADV